MSTTYTDVFAAIVGMIKADAACSTKIPGGVHAGQAPPDSLTKGTTAVVVEVGGSPAFTTETGGVGTATRIDDGMIQVSLYARTRDVAVDAGTAVAAAINRQQPTLTTGIVVLIRQTSRFAELDPDLGPNGQPVWRELREFRVVTAQEA